MRQDYHLKPQENLPSVEFATAHILRCLREAREGDSAIIDWIIVAGEFDLPWRKAIMFRVATSLSFQTILDNTIDPSPSYAQEMHLRVLNYVAELPDFASL